MPWMTSPCLDALSFFATDFYLFAFFPQTHIRFKTIGGKSPSLTACFTAQPGSLVCVQSRKRHFWQQGRAFNNWITKAMAGPRLSRSNHVCGGCLALHRETYRRLSFDPWIMRGEDMDYLLSLRMYGSDIWFDNQWSLTHLPPKDRNEGHRFYRDIFRWIYEYYKIEFSRAQIDLLQIKPSSLMPYPGPFLEPGITKRIKRTAFLRSLVRPDKKAYREGARAATREATDYAQVNCMKYFEFQYTWGDIMLRMEVMRVFAKPWSMPQWRVKRARILWSLKQLQWLIILSKKLRQRSQKQISIQV